ncbi:ATP-binding protein [Erythrobacter aureus]|nr:DUF87 domain-containing protein [Erythrobacter aureus]
MMVDIGRAKFPSKNPQDNPMIVWDPSRAISGHAMIVGSSGVGKTYRLRYLIRSLIEANRNVNIHILDVHGDIAPQANNRVIFSETTEYGLNPLEVVTDPEFGGVRRRINSIIAMINRTTTKLGVRQEATLRALLSDLYTANGYDPKDPRTWDPRSNPKARGRTAKTKRHPGISDLAAMCAWRLNVLVTGGGADAYRALHMVNRLARQEGADSDLAKRALTEVQQLAKNADGVEVNHILGEIEKLAKKINKESVKGTNTDSSKLDSAITKASDTYDAFLQSIKSGRELEEYIKYDSVEVLKAVHERIKGLDAAGIFKDQPPDFSQSDPLRVYDIKALSEDEQSMFAEVLLERLFVEAKSRGQKDAPDTFIVIDEAHKFMSTDGEHIINRMAREVRKFGVGLILVSQNFDHFPEDLIANSAMTMILGLHDMHHSKAERKLGLKTGKLKFIKPRYSAMVQVRSGAGNGLANAFNDVVLS